MIRTYEGPLRSAVSRRLDAHWDFIVGCSQLAAFGAVNLSGRAFGVPQASSI